MFCLKLKISITTRTLFFSVAAKFPKGPEKVHKSVSSFSVLWVIISAYQKVSILVRKEGTVLSMTELSNH